MFCYAVPFVSSSNHSLYPFPYRGWGSHNQLPSRRVLNCLTRYARVQRWWRTRVQCARTLAFCIQKRVHAHLYAAYTCTCMSDEQTGGYDFFHCLSRIMPMKWLEILRAVLHEFYRYDYAFPSSFDCHAFAASCLSAARLNSSVRSITMRNVAELRPLVPFLLKFFARFCQFFLKNFASRIICNLRLIYAHLETPRERKENKNILYIPSHLNILQWRGLLSNFDLLLLLLLLLLSLLLLSLTYLLW